MKFLISKKYPGKIHRYDKLSVRHLVNIIDYLHGHLLIHYMQENTVTRKLTLANKVTVAPQSCVNFIVTVYPINIAITQEMLIHISAKFR